MVPGCEIMRGICAHGDRIGFLWKSGKADFPWVFEKGDRPSLVVSTLEALAILVALKLRSGETSTDDTRVLIALR